MDEHRLPEENASTAHCALQIASKAQTVRLHTGEIAALIAPNGAGKTRLMFQILGRIDAAPATIEIFGRPPGDARNRGRIAVLADNAGLAPNATALESVAWAAWLRSARATNARASAYAKDALRAIGCAASLWNTETAALSRGEQRRVALAMALAGEGARLIVLDEPLTHLDAGAEAAACMALRKAAAAGAAVLALTPKPGAEHTAADRVWEAVGHREPADA